MGAAGGELDTLIQQNPAEVNLQRLSRDFGTPHPVLAQNYRCELLNVQPFPAFGGNSSRLLGESWDSTNLYWARLADEKGLLAGYAQSPGSRADPAHGGQYFRHRYRRLAGADPRHARNRRRIQAGQNRRGHR